MLPLKLVLDTNVVVSAHLNPDGLQRAVLTIALTSPARLFLTPDILAEYTGVLHRKKLRIDPAAADESLQLIRNRARMVRPRRRLAVSPDPDDNRFLECAETAGADYLVTGNKRHFPKAWGKTKVVNARELLELIAPVLKP
jgi:uncharacterized protein